MLGYKIDTRAAIMLSDIFPNRLECEVLNMRMQSGGTVVITIQG